MTAVQEYLDRAIGPRPTDISDADAAAAQDKVAGFLASGDAPAHILELDMTEAQRRFVSWWLRRMAAYKEYQLTHENG